jgi:putative membrane protein
LPSIAFDSGGHSGHGSFVAHAFTTEAARARLREAVEAVERRSSAEIAVAVRKQAAPHHAAEWIGGALTAYLMLLLMLFSPPVFALPWIAVDTVLALGLGIGLVRMSPGLRRALVSSAEREAAALQAARATFVELGITATRERSGILVYVALLERRIEVIADRGVTDRVDVDAWVRARASIVDAAAALSAGSPGIETLAKAVESLADVLEHPLPRRADDIDELQDVA